MNVDRSRSKANFTMKIIVTCYHFIDDHGFFANQANGSSWFVTKLTPNACGHMCVCSVRICQAVRGEQNRKKIKTRRLDVTILCCLVGMFVVPILSALCSFDSVLDMFVYIQNYYIYLDYAFGVGCFVRVVRHQHHTTHTHTHTLRANWIVWSYKLYVKYVFRP